MKTLVACSAAAVLLVTGLSAFAGDPAGSMLLRLAVGQRIEMKPSPYSNGVEITIYPEKQWKAFPQGYALPPQILEIYPDYIVVEVKPGLRQIVNGNIIHFITQWVPVTPVVPVVVPGAAVVPGGPAVVPGGPAVVPGGAVVPANPAVAPGGPAVPGPAPGAPGPAVAPAAPAPPVAPPIPAAAP